MSARSERAERRAAKRRNQRILLGVVLFLLIALIGYVIYASFVNKNQNTAQKANMTQLPSGLMYEDLVVGSGQEAKSGNNVSVHYTGWLADGTKFDSSVDRGQPFSFVLGAGNVIPGWDQGVQGMKVGGKRRLVIPPDLAYGPQGYGPIPPNATLTFEIELLNVQ